jgi:hypothetical protein
MAYSGRQLSIQILVVDLTWSPVPECGMKTLGIVSKLDVRRHISAGPFPGGVGGTVHPLNFEGSIERFRHGVVVALSGQSKIGPPDGPDNAC